MFQKYKNHFIKIYKKSKVRYRTFPQHVDIVVKWTEKLCKLNPGVDKEVAIIGAWFHDLGHFIGKEKDHAVSSEKEALKFLRREKFNEEKIKRILHVVRSHRNRDVKPKTIEAKIVCCADSASHFTSDAYLIILLDNIDSRDYILGKIDRDYRDISVFPKIKKELTPLYKSWKKLIESFPNDFIKHISK